MKSFDDLDEIIDIIIACNLPKEHIMFMDDDAYYATNKFLKGIGSGNIESVNLVFGGEEKDLKVIKVHYMGCVFNIIKY